MNLRRPSLVAALAVALLATPALAQETGDLTPQEQLKALVEQGQQQFAEGDFESAVQSFSTVVNAYERAGAYAPGPLLLRAKTYAQLEEYEAAIEDLKKAQQYAQGQPQFLPEIQNTRGEVYMLVEAYQAALPDLQAAVKANRGNPQYQFNFGKSLVKLGGAQQGEKALSKYLASEKAANEPEQRAEALRLRGAAYGATGKFPEAEADLAASLEIEPDNYEAYFTLAQIALNQQNYAGANQHLQTAIDNYTPKNPEDTLPFVQAYLLRASVFEEMGKEAAKAGDHQAAAAQYAACKDQCEQLLALLPEGNPRVLSVRVATLFRKGVAERLLGELSEGVKSFSMALQIDPNQGEAYFRRGICFHFMGEQRLAIRDFEQAASISFDSPRSNLWKGMAWAKLGDYDEAIRAYGESVAVSDRYLPAYVNRGLAFMASGEHAKAIADFNEAIRLQPTEAMHYYRRGKAQAMAGERDNAIQSYMNAIGFNENLVAAYEALADELTASGKTALAGEYRRRAAELGN